MAARVCANCGWVPVGSPTTWLVGRIRHAPKPKVKITGAGKVTAAPTRGTWRRGVPREREPGVGGRRVVGARTVVEDDPVRVVVGDRARSSRPSPGRRSPRWATTSGNVLSAARPISPKIERAEGAGRRRTASRRRRRSRSTERSAGTPRPRRPRVAVSSAAPVRHAVPGRAQSVPGTWVLAVTVPSDETVRSDAVVVGGDLGRARELADRAGDLDRVADRRVGRRSRRGRRRRRSRRTRWRCQRRGSGCRSR